MRTLYRVAPDRSTESKLTARTGGRCLNPPSDTEVDPGGSTPRDKARLMIESIGINAAGKSTRRTLRDVTGCTVHHAALSPTTEELTYSRYCDDGASA